MTVGHIVSPTVTDDRPELGSIVGDAEHFLLRVFGQGPWRGHSRSAHRLFGIDDVDRLVASAVRFPAIRMVRDGERVPPDQFCSPTRIGSTTLDDVADARKVIDQFRRGATLVLQSLHRTWGPLSACCAALEREIGWPVQANAYLTPPGERALAPHADGHDVVVIQLHGRKAWNVDDLGAVDLDVGDVLYLPAGLVHCARTDVGPSLHLTVGVHRPTADRIARTAATMAIERARPPAGTAPETSLALMRDILDDIDADEIVQRLRRRPRTPAVGLLASSVARGELSDSTPIAPIGAWAVETCGDRVTLDWSGGRLFVPERAAAALRLLAGHGGALPIGRLPGLDPDERMVLARRLLDEGAATAKVTAEDRSRSEDPAT